MRHKRKLKFKGYKNCLKATQLKKKNTPTRKSRVNKESPLEKHNEFIKTINLKHNKDLKVKGIIFLLKNLIKFK